jgi:hypothetical protein
LLTKLVLAEAMEGRKEGRKEAVEGRKEEGRKERRGKEKK